VRALLVGIHEARTWHRGECADTAADCGDFYELATKSLILHWRGPPSREIALLVRRPAAPISAASEPARGTLRLARAPSTSLRDLRLACPFARLLDAFC